MKAGEQVQLQLSPGVVEKVAGVAASGRIKE